MQRTPCLETGRQTRYKVLWRIFSLEEVSILFAQVKSIKDDWAEGGHAAMSDIMPINLNIRSTSSRLPTQSTLNCWQSCRALRMISLSAEKEV
jgi:hypothetical protein